MPDGFEQLQARDAVLPVYDPAFTTPDNVDWPGDTLVIGVELGGLARAYPVRFLDKREMVLDDLGEPILVTWCPRCGTAMVHSRRLDDGTLVFGHQGALWQGAMTWWDHDTGSIWSQPFGRCIAGPRRGAELRLLPSTMTSWDAWRSTHPHTDALAAPRRPDVRDTGALVLAIAVGDEALGFPVSRLRRRKVVNGHIAGVPVVAVADPDDRGVGVVFDRRRAGRTLTLALRDGKMLDLETGTTWEAHSGKALAGALDGDSLRRLATMTVTPSDFDTFWPGGVLWGRSEPDETSGE